MKSITRLSLALIMFALLSISYLVTTVAADPRGNTGIQKQWGTQPQNAPQGNYNAPRNSNGTFGSHQRGGQAGPTHGGAYGAPITPHLPEREAIDAAGSSYHLNQPVNQGGVNGVIAPLVGQANSRPNIRTQVPR
jgi:hypothetical protein